MNKLFPHSENFEKDSLYNDLKNEFQENKKYVERQKLFSKLSGRNIFLQMFSFLLAFRCLNSFSWRENESATTIKVIISVVFIGFLYLNYDLFLGSNSLGVKEIIINSSILSVLAFIAAGLFTAPAISELTRKLDHKGCWVSYRSGIKEVSSIYPEFLNKMLTKEQLVKLKNEISEYEFEKVFTLGKDGEIGVSYSSAMAALYYNYDFNRVKEKTEEEILKEKEQALIRKKAKEIYKNL